VTAVHPMILYLQQIQINQNAQRKTL